MSASGAHSWRFLLAMGTLLMVLLTHACDVPVFRYALERWPSDDYQVVIFHRGPLARNQQGLVDKLAAYAGQQSANGHISLVDLAGEQNQRVKDLWDAQNTTALPWVVVRAPGDDEAAERAWAGPLTAVTAGGLLTSPARKELVRRISAGDSVVWVMVESGDRAKDDAVAARLSENLAELEKTLSLPVAAGASGPGGRPLAAVPPLRLAFSSLRVSRTDQQEAPFVGMLLHSDPLSSGLSGPIVFPVFGRGRALAALAGKDLEPVIVKEAAEYLIGACSCQVKEQNPGADLLLAADWDGLVTNGVVRDPELPSFADLVELPPPAASAGLAPGTPAIPGKARKFAAPAGQGQSIPLAAAPGATSPALSSQATEQPMASTPGAVPAEALPAAQVAASHAVVGGDLARNLMLAVVAGLVLSVIATLMLLRKRSSSGA